jgi:hypothetical protein
VPAYGAIGPSFTNPLTGQILGADITVEWKSGAGTPNSDDLYHGNATTTLPWNDPLQLQLLHSLSGLAKIILEHAHWHQN